MTHGMDRIHRGGYTGLPVELWRGVGENLTGEDLAYAQALSREHRNQHAQQVENDALGEIGRGRPMARTFRTTFQSADDYLEFIKSDFPALAAERGDSWTTGYITNILRFSNHLHDRNSWRHPAHFGSYVRAYARALRVPHSVLRESFIKTAIARFRSTIEHLMNIDPHSHPVFAEHPTRQMMQLAVALHSMATELGPQLECSRLMNAIEEFTRTITPGLRYRRMPPLRNLRRDILPVGKALDLVAQAFLPDDHV